MDAPDPVAYFVAVRRRPGMFIGDTRDGSGLLHMLWEVVGNAFDQFLAGHATRIAITLEADGRVTVEDDGLGMPVHQVDGQTFVERVLTSPHFTPTADDHTPHEHLGLHAVGLSVVNALSERLVLDIHRDGVHHAQAYVRGQPVAPLQSQGATGQRGTRISFLPDADIFAHGRLDAGAVAARLQELAWLNPPLEFLFQDQRTHRFVEPRGLEGFFQRRHGHGGTAALGPWPVEGRHGTVHVQALAQWQEGAQVGHLESYANVERTTDHGAHVEGLLDALVAGLRHVFGDLCRGQPSRRMRPLVRQGLTAVVCVRLSDPAYARPTRDRLRSPLARDAVREVVRPAFEAFLQGDPARGEFFRKKLALLQRPPTRKK
jgi:DNA gyrase subunit B